jgi:two-component system sensor histidine kinase EvgS
MPVMDGHTLARSIRAKEREAGSPACRIIGVTANAQAEERQRCLDSGMDECLFKPIGLQALRACLPLATALPSQTAEELRPSGFDLAQLRHLTQDDDQLIRRLLEQLAQSSAEDLQALQALGANPLPEALAPVVHRVKGGARMLKVKGVKQDCEALEQAILQNLPVDQLLARLLASLQGLERELRHSLNAIEGSS